MAIVQRGGRWRSVRTPVERADSVNDAVGHLKTESEKAALKLILDEWKSGRESILVNEVADVEWDEIPLPVDEWLMREDMVGETGQDMYPQLRDDLKELFEGGYSEAVLCLHPDTRVPLLDGTTPSIKELADRWLADQKPFWVYSHVNGEIAPAMAIQPRQTGVDDYFRVTLDDGSTFVGNARHQMLQCDGSKVMIRDMRTGDSLMPFHVKLSSTQDGDRIDGYEKLRLLSGDWIYTHRLVAKQVPKLDGDEDTIHHEDFNKLNNAPDNLLWMRWRDHIALHSKFYAEWRAANPEAAAAKDAAHAAHLASLWDGDSGEERREEHAERLRELNLNGLATIAGKLAWTNRSEEAKVAFAEMMAIRNRELASDRRTDISVSSIRAARKPTLRETARALGCSPSRIRKVLRDAGVDARDLFGTSFGRGRKNKIDSANPPGPKPKLSLQDIKQAIKSGADTTRAAAKKLGVNKKTIYNTLKRHGMVWADLCETVGNHFVVKVEKVGRGPVYCLSVPGSGNFAISSARKEGQDIRSGVFSSNTGAIGWG